MCGNFEEECLALAILSFLHAVYCSQILHYGHEPSLFFPNQEKCKESAVIIPCGIKLFVSPAVIIGIVLSESSAGLIKLG